MGIIKQKICLLGSFGVGKTSLMERYVNDRFDEKYLSTVGISVSQKLMPPITDRNSGRTIQYMFMIWDIAGLEKFDPKVMNYFRGASGALAVSDLTRPSTIENLDPICNKFMTINPHANLVAVGNKLDRVDDTEEASSGLNRFASQWSADMVLTSAKSGIGVEAAFVSLSKNIEVLDEKSI